MVAIEPVRHEALRSSVATLRRTADYELPAELDRRLLDLMERKESLAAGEKAELLAWVGFTQQRIVRRAGERRDDHDRIGLRGIGWIPIRVKLQ